MAVFAFPKVSISCFWHFIGVPN